MTDELYQFTVRSAHPVDLASGRMVAEPDKVLLTREEMEHPHNKVLIEQRTLVGSGKAVSGPDATPDAVKLAESKGIDLVQVTGTGKNGRILVEDVKAYLEEQEEAEAKEGGS